MEDVTTFKRKALASPPQKITQRLLQIHGPPEVVSKDREHQAECPGRMPGQYPKSLKLGSPWKREKEGNLKGIRGPRI